MPTQNQNMSQEIRKEQLPGQIGGGGDKIEKEKELLITTLSKKITLIVKAYNELSKKESSEKVKNDLEQVKTNIEAITDLIKNGTLKLGNFDNETRRFFESKLEENNNT